MYSNVIVMRYRMVILCLGLQSWHVLTLYILIPSTQVGLSTDCLARLHWPDGSCSQKLEGIRCRPPLRGSTLPSFGRIRLWWWLSHPAPELRGQTQRWKHQTTLMRNTGRKQQQGVKWSGLPPLDPPKWLTNYSKKQTGWWHRLPEWS